jgi:hypothetical protein
MNSWESVSQTKRGAAESGSKPDAEGGQAAIKRGEKITSNYYVKIYKNTSKSFT